MITCYTLDFTA
ncbi:hypothetical protein Tsp_01945, partial [Trichinella spiralis]